MVLVVALLTGGLLGLLMLNTALNEGTFELSRLQKQTTELTDQQQTLQQQINQGSAPDALERRARELGMVPGGDPAFLQDDGKVIGKPGQAQDGAPVKRSGTDMWPQAGSPSPVPNPSSGASPGTGASPGASQGGDGGVQIDPAPPVNPSAPAGGTPR
ncbi:septum formation initiator family protein [Kitasatospora kazusensis]|uniref:septum formation initiator family protein n=1 Tax=Kitasatospora kazusensis TaxID=407974 RepID=UPI0031D3E3D0